MNEYEIESPLRTNAIIAAARSMNIDDTDLIGYTFDAIDEQHHHAYDAINDARISIILIINALTGYDDDHDDMTHDLSHALNLTDECSDHPANCATCCDLHE
jgi:hypothetical protein